MATRQIFKDAGRVAYADSIHRWLDAQLATLPNGTHVITIARKGARRSLAQNSIMWMWFTCLADATGTTAQDVHDHYCAMFLSRPDTLGEGTVSGGTKGLSVGLMTEFLDKVQADAATEFGIRLPNRDDLLFEEFYKTYIDRI